MMKKIQVAAAVALALSSVSFAQQAVQWKVSDGGNGHWYQMRLPGPITWPSAKIDAERLGGHLATPTTEAEKSFVTSLILAVPGFGESATYRWGPWLGGFQDRSAPTYTEPSGAWRWITGEQWGYSAWRMDEPNNLCSQTQEQEDFLAVSGNGVQSNGAWNDLPPSGCGNDPVVSYIIEWSADCNNDGIVDYGQCRDGSLPDYNGNNIPDCCESGTPCVVGNYPVEWRVVDGGNGHWYAVDLTPLWWDPWNQRAALLGAQLASVTSLSEQRHVVSLIGPMTNGGYPQLLWLGALRRQCTWSWTSGEPWNFTSWAQGNPNGGCIDAQLGIFVNQTQPQYNLGWDDCICPSNGEPTAAVLEWSADCNGDGIVDKGQILRGQLVDSDNDGIPNVCECACDVFRDFNVNGIDLGILLGQWGPANQFTVTDFNQDGSVDGVDLGILLGAWGPCPN